MAAPTPINGWVIVGMTRTFNLKEGKLITAPVVAVAKDATGISVGDTIAFVEERGTEFRDAEGTALIAVKGADVVAVVEAVAAPGTAKAAGK